MDDPLSLICAGCEATHAEFGRGVVLEYRPPAEIVVRFDDEAIGDRRLHLQYAPLTLSRNGVTIDFADAFSEVELNREWSLRLTASVRLISGVIVVSDYLDASSLRGAVPSLPKMVGESAEVMGEHVSEGVLLETGVRDRDVDVFAVQDADIDSADVYGYLVWLEEEPPQADFLDSPERLEFLGAGWFGVDSGGFQIVDQAVLLALADDPEALAHAVEVLPRFSGDGDGYYFASLAYRGAQLAGIYMPIRGLRLFPPLENIRRSTFTGELSRGLRLQSAAISDIDARGTSIRDLRLESCSVRNSRFDGADLTGSLIEESLVSGCSFEAADLSDAAFDGAIFTNVSFAGARAPRALTECRFDDCDLSGLDGVPEFLDFNVFFGTRFGAIECTGLRFEGLIVDCDLAGARLSGAQLNGVDLEGSNLAGALLDKAKMNGATLHRTNLKGTSLREASLRGVQGAGVVLAEADLELAQLVDADLRGADLRGANLTNANLRGADLTGAILDDAGLKQTKFQGATMPDGSTHD